MFIKNFCNSSRILKHVPQCTRFVERRLAYRFIKNNCLKSGRLLVIMNLICVFRVSAGYTKSGIVGSDLLQEGIVGLMKAIIRFNPDYGVRLSTFSFFWIRKEINGFVRSNKRSVIVEHSLMSLISRNGFTNYVTNDYIYLSEYNSSLMHTVSNIRLRLSSGIEQLAIRDRCFLTGQYLFNNKLTLNELSFLYSITLERVRQINVGTLKLLRSFLN